MLSLICAVSLAFVAQPGPAEVHAASLHDLVTRVPPERQRDTRYVSLHAAPAGPERDSLYRSLVFALNSTSWRSSLSQPPRVYGGVLVRLSLAGLSWDATSRAARIERLKGQGVDTSSFKADLWEEIVKAEPYFFTDAIYPNGKVLRGWLDPVADEELRRRTYSTKAVVRADWLVQRLLREAPDGVYSQALLLPPVESDLYKGFGVDEKLVGSDPVLRSGGAVLDSIVALHNRELQLIYSAYGYDEKFIWRTFDFAADSIGDKSVIDTLGGKVKHDGREIIGTLPNGLHWGYLADGQGRQVVFVPQNIAIDQRSGAFEKLKDRTVSNFYKCISCHGPSNGLMPFEDVVGKAIRASGVNLAVVSKSKDLVGQVSGELEDYYLSGVAGKLARQQVSYRDRVKACNGLDSGTNSQIINETVEDYVFALVTPEQAAREIGLPLEAARVSFRASGNNHAALLAGGIPIRRGPWEQEAYLRVQQSNVYEWERAKKP